MDDDGNVKIADFGLSRINIIRTRATMASGRGTVRWQAPELLFSADDADEDLDEDGHVTMMSDMFAFGMTLYEVRFRLLYLITQSCQSDFTCYVFASHIRNENPDLYQRCPIPAFA